MVICAWMPKTFLDNSRAFWKVNRIKRIAGQICRRRWSFDFVFYLRNDNSILINISIYEEIFSIIEIAMHLHGAGIEGE